MTNAYAVGTFDTKGRELGRMAGRGSLAGLLAYGNANDIVVEMAREVLLVAAARAADLLTTPYVFSADDAIAMTRAGADIIGCHMGLTTGGAIGAGTAKTLDDLVDEWSAAAAGIRDDVIVRCQGGPISSPDDAEYVLSRTAAGHGYDELWQLVRDFNGLAGWHPAIESSEIEGGGSAGSAGRVRRLTLGDGGVVRERLVALDDTDRSYTYDILDSLFAVRRYRSAIRVVPGDQHRGGLRRAVVGVRRRLRRRDGPDRHLRRRGLCHRPGCAACSLPVSDITSVRTAAGHHTHTLAA